jgi:hypothetical protein
MEKQFVTNEIAFKLKKLEFDEPCIKMVLIGGAVGFSSKESGILQSPITNSQGGKYTITLPLWQQVIDWLDETYDISIVVAKNSKEIMEYVKIKDPTIDVEKSLFRWHFVDQVGQGTAPTALKAKENAILKAIESIENK